ncbi:hypothetical protein GS399_02455 [Pedobacter sp. HMF7647]|uniref:Uncharacterized protein n=1 Tax=Hufsiella arboris TaxID=2695275 RepID=A0A7K1Y5E4_9SPHI|nr:hypothetical protein [Hufsiella arboris]MXV49816.1 hypothetical protein [Hufsiella arboris]
MAILNVSDLLNTMLGAAKESAAEKWPVMKDLATLSFKNISQNLVQIELMKLKGTITEEQSKLLIEMQKNAFKMMLLAQETVGLLIVEHTLNAALDAVRAVVNTAVGWTII